MSSKSMMTVAYCLWNSPDTDLLRACCCRMSKVNRTHHHSLLHTVIPTANKIDSIVQFRVSAHRSVFDGPNEFGRGAYLCKCPPLPSRPRSTWLHVYPGKRPPSACYSTYIVHVHVHVHKAWRVDYLPGKRKAMAVSSRTRRAWSTMWT